ncbi:swr complex subunit [Umbelopsis sp. WA50703]
MSGSDIRDILQIGKPTEPAPRKLKQTSEKKPEGLSRELYSLIGGAPPIAFIKPNYKAKLSFQQKAVPWEFRQFTNPARTDGLVLRHWVKENDNSDGDYYFAKFNKVINVTDYTDEEYEKYLTDPNWTKEETDYLFALCKKYDLRFVVITDRYEYPGSDRSMEDLKERYYGVNQMLLRERVPSAGSTDLSQDRQTLIQQFSFDKSKEVERKKALEVLLNRSPEQIEEEEALFVEARRLEQNDMKLAKEREQLLKFLQTYDIQQTLPVTPGSAGTALQGQAGLATPGGIGIAGGSGSLPTHDKMKKKKSQPEADPKKARRMSNASVSSSVNEELTEKKEKLTPGVYVRSQKIPPIKPNMIQKVGKVMDEIGIPIRPIMPTAQVCAKFEQLQTAIITLLDLKRQVDRQENDLKVKKAQKSKDGTPTTPNQDGVVNRKRSASNAGLNSRDKRKKA